MTLLILILEIAVRKRFRINNWALYFWFSGLKDLRTYFIREKLTPWNVYFSHDTRPLSNWKNKSYVSQTVSISVGLLERYRPSEISRRNYILFTINHWKFPCLFCIFLFHSVKDRKTKLSELEDRFYERCSLYFVSFFRSLCVLWFPFLNGYYK